jgi:hypothetical protein
MVFGEVSDRVRVRYPSLRLLVQRGYSAAALAASFGLTRLIPPGLTPCVPVPASMPIYGSKFYINLAFEPLCVANHNGLASWLNESVFAPLGKNAADREQGRSRHLRQFLARE